MRDGSGQTPVHPNSEAQVSDGLHFVDFSFWPMTGGQNPKPQHQVFATDPWAFMAKRVRESKESFTGQKEATLAYLHQAEAFFVAATTAGVQAARPLLSYYYAMNLAKAFCTSHDEPMDFESDRRPCMHGIGHADPKKGEDGTELPLSELKPDLHKMLLGAHASDKDKINLYGDFWTKLTDQKRPNRIPVETLMSQTLIAHRLWCEAHDSLDRFISIKKVEFWCDEEKHQVWIEFLMDPEDLGRVDVDQDTLLEKSKLSGEYGPEKSRKQTEAALYRYRMKRPVSYGRSPSEKLNELASEFKKSLSRTVLSAPPYRKYYLYLHNGSEKLIPQVLSMYALAFCFGSVARYRPLLFESILQQKYGAFISEFLTYFPNQFLYLMASEFAKREVTRAAIV
ncbi:MAG: hypothetical protein KF858_05090 [Candidatus Sumerlaeia bacterium]|nr:hypothetical protein [Candidatus Sumerlaeia bacterium]